MLFASRSVHLIHVWSNTLGKYSKRVTLNIKLSDDGNQTSLLKKLWKSSASPTSVPEFNASALKTSVEHPKASHNPNITSSFATPSNFTHLKNNLNKLFSYNAPHTFKRMWVCKFSNNLSKYSLQHQKRRFHNEKEWMPFPYDTTLLSLAPISFIVKASELNTEDNPNSSNTTSSSSSNTSSSSDNSDSKVLGSEEAKKMAEELIYNSKLTLRMIIRITELCIVFLPAAITFPLAVFFPFMFNKMWWKLFTKSLEIAGPCWMKLGQWASTRPDLFSEEVCLQLSKLHNNCPTHSWKATQRIIQTELGKPIDEIFEHFDRKALASGAIAQVHKATLKDGTQVAVKVRHPNAERLVLLDLSVMSFVARQLNKIPNVEFMSILDAVQEFTGSMLGQLDLRTEALHLERFRENFKDVKEITFPRPIQEYNYSPAVLVETMEEGEPLMKYLGAKNEFSKKMAEIGMDAYMKMALIDHYVHADLHPGNILVRVGPNDEIQLVILDVGLVCVLSPTDAEHFVELFKAVAKGDGRYGTELMIKHAREPPRFDSAESEEYFKTEMARLFESARQKKLSELDFGEFLGNVLHLMRTYHVKIEGNFATLILGTLVLEGIGRQLDPDINFISAAVPFLFRAKLPDSQFLNRVREGLAMWGPLSRQPRAAVSV